MMSALLVAGIATILVGALAMVYGLSIKEFGFGNTIMIVGTLSIGTGMIMLAFWAVLAELRNISQKLAPRSAEARAKPALPVPAAAATPAAEVIPYSREEPVREAEAKASPAPAMPPAPWQEDGSRARTSGQMPPAPPFEVGPPPKPSRNLMFSPASRKQRERERSVRPPEQATDETPAPAETAEAPAGAFDAAWPKPERAATEPVSQRRPLRPPSTFKDPASDQEGGDQKPAVTVVKSGVVDGMAYSLYSDGSIEAQMPEGMMRFGSIDELRSHLDQRP